MCLRTAIFKFYKLKNIFPISIIRNVYLSLYQAIFQYGIKVWGGLTQSALKPLQLQQNKIIRICLNKHKLEGSTLQNYKELRVLKIKSVYKKFAIM